MNSIDWFKWKWNAILLLLPLILLQCALRIRYVYTFSVLFLAHGIIPRNRRARYQNGKLKKNSLTLITVDLFMRFMKSQFGKILISYFSLTKLSSLLPCESTCKSELYINAVTTIFMSPFHCRNESLKHDKMKFKILFVIFVIIIGSTWTVSVSFTHFNFPISVSVYWFQFRFLVHRAGIERRWTRWEYRNCVHDCWCTKASNRLYEVCLVHRRRRILYSSMRFKYANSSSQCKLCTRTK